MPVTDSIAHSLTTENKVHFHNEEGEGKGKIAIMGEADCGKDGRLRSVRSLLGLPGRREMWNITRRLGGVLTGADR